MVRFPGPLRWFQRRLWRLKWLEATAVMFVCSGCVLAAGAGPSISVPAVAILTLSPLLGLYLLLSLKTGLFLMRCFPGSATVARLLTYWHDRWLSLVCAEPIVWSEHY